MSYDVMITGDLNFHVDIKSVVEARRFCSLLDSHRLTIVQVTKVATDYIWSSLENGAPS